jgi:hypothetical protein
MRSMYISAINSLYDDRHISCFIPTWLKIVIPVIASSPCRPVDRGKPVYLVIGNDSGNMSVRITQLLYDNGEIDAIDGIPSPLFVNKSLRFTPCATIAAYGIAVHGLTYSIYDRYGEVWRSEDNTATK